MNGYDAWLEGPATDPCRVDREDIEDRVSRHRQDDPFGLDVHTKFHRNGEDYEITVTRDRTSDTPGQDVVTDFGDIEEFEAWMLELEEMDEDDVDAFLIEAADEWSDAEQARQARIYARQTRTPAVSAAQERADRVYEGREHKYDRSAA